MTQENMKERSCVSRKNLWLDVMEEGVPASTKPGGCICLDDFTFCSSSKLKTIGRQSGRKSNQTKSSYEFSLISSLCGFVGKKMGWMRFQDFSLCMKGHLSDFPEIFFPIGLRVKGKCSLPPPSDGGYLHYPTMFSKDMLPLALSIFLLIHSLFKYKLFYELTMADLDRFLCKSCIFWNLTLECRCWHLLFYSGLSEPLEKLRHQ